jgi:hypothetical protein
LPSKDKGSHLDQFQIEKMKKIGEKMLRKQTGGK